MRLCAAPVLTVFLGCMLLAQSDAVADAVAALERGDAAAAEQTLRAELATHPNDVEALDVLAVVLDKQKKYSDADAIYRRALKSAPPSAGLLNNYGNHLIASGHSKDARAVFLKVLALDPGHVNAHVQLARLALDRKAGSEALTYLNAVPAAAQQNPDVILLRMQALYRLHRTAEADALLARVSTSADADPHLSFAIGVALASAKQYDKAETFFSHALVAAPGNFEVLYNLGLAASHAGHRERAREVLQKALDQQPDNVDVLYDLAAVDAQLNQRDTALELLAKAAHIAPDRPDIQLALARTTAELGYFGDAIEAWNRYLRLVPNDDVGRRERGFAETALGVNAVAGTADIQSFIRRYPDDPVGHYELAVVESAANAEEALAEFNRALALKPDFTAAHLGRALLLYRDGKPAEALPDLEFAAQHQPDNPNVLDRLGQTYLALDRTADAVRTLRKAADLAPRDPTTLMHLGRALLKAGDKDEANVVMARFRELGPNRSNVAHPAGLVDFLSLSPEEQYARYRAGVERTVTANPNNAEAQVEYLKLSLADGKMDQASATARQIIALKPNAALIADAARALLDAQQYALARDFLDQAIALAGSAGDLALDLAIATFHLENAQSGLRRMDQIPEAQRTGDYYLARAQMLDAAGSPADAVAAITQALSKSPTRPDLFSAATQVLIKNHRLAEALQLLAVAERILPENPDILLLRTTTLELAAKTEKPRQQ